MSASPHERSRAGAVDFIWGGNEVHKLARVYTQELDQKSVYKDIIPNS